MSKKHIVVKATGELEEFDRLKLASSLSRSGADEQTIENIIDEIIPWLKEGASTKELYNKAFSLLRKRKTSTAARYSLKKSIMELGPSGYPFEHFIGQLLKYQGFDVQVGVIVQGQCVNHEVDVVATSGNKQFIVECKFYNTQGKFAGVQVPLYIKSRVEDIIRKRTALPEFKDIDFHGWIVTNTRFTSDAVQFGKCAGLHLVGWDFPDKYSLRDMIEQNSFFPVTAMTSIEKMYKNILMNKGIVLCRQIRNNPEVLQEVGIKPMKVRKIMTEVEELCS
ncbi:MAG: restriction endonuclease [Candidatus Kapaibacterium sp.]|jgi:hypothetical protein|nr:restriction endonuclease [Candidatus Kapabacteria bacterium]